MDEAAAAGATVLITGSNRGIGLEFARQYAQAGWRVVATGGRCRGKAVGFRRGGSEACDNGAAPWRFGF